MQSSAAGNPDRFIVHPGSFDYHVVLFVNILSLSHKKSIQTLHFLWIYHIFSSFLFYRLDFVYIFYFCRLSSKYLLHCTLMLIHRVQKESCMYSVIQTIDLLLTIGFCITLWIPCSVFTTAIRYISIIVCVLLIFYFLTTKARSIDFVSRLAKVLAILTPFIWLGINTALLIAGK